MTAGKPDSLRCMLKLAEAHLAEAVYSAWDTLLADRPGAVMSVYTSNAVCTTTTDTEAVAQGACQCHSGSACNREDATDESDESESDEGMPCVQLSEILSSFEFTVADG